MKKIVDKLDILAFIYKNVKVSVNDIIKIFGISVSTAHRVLSKLSEENWVVIEQNTVLYMPFSHFDYVSNMESAIIKNALAYQAVKLISENDKICLSGGSTTIALMLPFIFLNKKNITIISNSSLILRYYLAFSELAIENNITLITIGGSLRKHFFSFGGEYAEDIIYNFNIDKTFMGTESVDVELGFFTETISEHFVESSFMEVSSKVYLVTSSEKFSIKKLYRWTDWDSISGIVTDYEANKFFNRSNFDVYQVDIHNLWV